MITVEEAKGIIFDRTRRLDPISSSLEEALGLVLAEDIHSDQDLPPFDNSAMDGFAVRSGDIENPLLVIGELAAGSLFEGEIKTGEALRIMTGAMLPPGADAVLKFEDSETRDGRVKALVSLRQGENVRRKGEDIKKGMKVLPEGLILRPAQLGVLASLGITKISVFPRPRVGILSTGDEVIAPGQPIMPGQIRDSNSTILAALVREAGGIPVLLGIAPDRREEIEKKFEEAKDFEAFITSGGVSMGDFDYVGETAKKRGKIFFDQVAQQPGKPFTFGEVNEKPFFGLPGNPVSTMVTFTLYLRPALRKMMGYEELEAPRCLVRIEEDIEKRKKRRQFLRAVREKNSSGEILARLTGPQGSGILRSMAIADSLLIVPEGEGSFEKGTLLEAIPL
ncbi:MAG TPA: molybdopterin molybdenumtransferase MoeA [Cyanobacteria bacterium UBA8530]|nr:molybdopterin molybdenumtransferase MoeA [Cyanobacteria bacterium UBA8530]